MTADDFVSWRILVNDRERPLSDRKTAELLGCTPKTVRSWSQNGAPRYVALACAAIVFGLPEWTRRGV